MATVKQRAVVVVAGTVMTLSAAGSVAGGVGAYNQYSASSEVKEQLRVLADREREGAQRLTRVESDISWLVRQLGGVPAVQPSATAPTRSSIR
jgi:hypothetical protein